MRSLLTMLYDITNSWGTGASNTDKDVVMAASLDAGLLHSAEWIKFISLFFNAEAKVRSSHLTVCHHAVTLINIDMLSVCDRSALFAQPNKPLLVPVKNGHQLISLGNQQHLQIEFQTSQDLVKCVDSAVMALTRLA